MPDIRDILNEVYMRTQRTRPSGLRSTQRTIQYYAEILGIEDTLRIRDYSYPILDNLLSWWPLDDYSISGSTADDIWGSEGTAFNDGTITGAVAAIGKIREALDFDGTNDLMTVTDQSSIQNIFDGGGSIEFILDPDATQGATLDDILSKVWRVELAESTSPYNLGIVIPFSGTTGEWSTTSTPLASGTLSHVIITYDSDATGNNPLCYMDGVSVALTIDTTPVGTRTTDAGTDLIIGSATVGIGGILDEIRVYSDILTPDEVEHNFNTRAFFRAGSIYVGEWTPLG